jgi:hypothetical protein
MLQSWQAAHQTPVQLPVTHAFADVSALLFS